MLPRAPSSATPAWPTKIATLLFSSGLTSLAILHAGSSACSPQPVTSEVVEVTKVEPAPQSPFAVARPATAPNPPAPATPAKDPPPPRYLGGSKSAEVIVPQPAQATPKQQGAR